MKNLLFTCAAALLFAAPSYAETYNVFGANLTPFSISELEKGFHHEVIEQMAQEAGVDISFNYMDWGMAQNMVQEVPNSFLMGPTRSAAREAKYSWTAKLSTPSAVFVTLSKTAPDSFEDAIEQNLRIIVLANTPREKQLKEAGVNYTLVSSPSEAVLVLVGGEADAWYTLDLRAGYVWKNMNLAMDDMHVGAPVHTSNLYLAAHLDMPKDVQDKMAAALDVLIENGAYATLEEKYFGRSGLRH